MSLPGKPEMTQGSDGAPRTLLSDSLRGENKKGKMGLRREFCEVNQKKRIRTESFLSTHSAGISKENKIK